MNNRIWWLIDIGLAGSTVVMAYCAPTVNIIFLPLAVGWVCADLWIGYTRW